MLERMHAVVQQAFGGPEVLEVAEVDRPVPLATEVLVRVKAVGVNPVEPLIRSGQFPLIGQPPRSSPPRDSPPRPSGSATGTSRSAISPEPVPAPPPT
jgi:NADPH:quinone reductase-like Zn-dependent oxidoreductase